MKVKFKKNAPLLLMALPGIILTFMFSYMPMFGVILAFKRVDLRQGIFGSEWYGPVSYTHLRAHET